MVRFSDHPEEVSTISILSGIKAAPRTGSQLSQELQATLAQIGDEADRRDAVVQEQLRELQAEQADLRQVQRQVEASDSTA